MSRVKTDHLLLALDFFEDDAVLEIGELYDEAALLFVVKVLMLMSGTTGGIVSRLAARAKRGKLSKEKADEILEACIGNGLFRDEGNGKISNDPVSRDQESLFKNRERWRRAKGKTEDSSETPRGNKEEQPRKSEHLNTEGSEDLKTEGDPPGRKKFGKYVWLSEIDHAGLVASQGAEVVKRAIELMDAHVDKAANSQEFEPRKRVARFGASGWLGDWALHRARKQIDESRPKPGAQGSREPTRSVSREESNHPAVVAGRRREQEQKNHKPITGDPLALLTPEQRAMREKLIGKTAEVATDA